MRINHIVLIRKLFYGKCCLKKLPKIIANIIFIQYRKEGDVRSVMLRSFSIGRVSGRRSRSYNVAGGSPCLPDEGHTVYRRAHPSSDLQKCRFRLFVSNECGICGHRCERWHDPSVVRVVSPRRPRNDLRKVVLVEDSKSTRREVRCIKPLSRTNTSNTLFITE